MTSVQQSVPTSVEFRTDHHLSKGSCRAPTTVRWLQVTDMGSLQPKDGDTRRGIRQTHLSEVGDRRGFPFTTLSLSQSLPSFRSLFRSVVGSVSVREKMSEESLLDGGVDGVVGLRNDPRRGEVPSPEASPHVGTPVESRRSVCDTTPLTSSSSLTEDRSRGRSVLLLQSLGCVRDT